MWFLSAIISGIVVSLVLFWLMQAMISNHQHSLIKTEALHMTEFIRLKREIKPQTKDRKVPDEPPPEKRPPPPKIQMQQTFVKQHNFLKIDMPNLDLPLQIDQFNDPILLGMQMGKDKVNNDIIPLPCILRIEPEYPRRAIKRRIEGSVKVEFTITKQGTVKDAVVVESQPNKIFDKAALQAIRQWKCKARVLDDEAFEQRAVQLFKFKLPK